MHCSENHSPANDRFGGFDVAAALCFKAEDKEFIYKAIADEWGEPIDERARRIHPLTTKIKLLLAESIIASLMAAPHQAAAAGGAPPGAPPAAPPPRACCRRR